MTAVLTRIDDPRDNLEKARRMELVAFAKAQGVEGISEDMPAMLIRKRLRTLGLTQIAIPQRILGQTTARHADAPMGLPGVGERVAEVDADADLERQFANRELSVDEMNYNQLKDELKRRGVKRGRADRLPDLREKVRKARQ